MNQFEQEMEEKKEKVRVRLEEIATKEELAMMYDYAIERSVRIHEVEVEGIIEYWIMFCSPSCWLTYSKHETLEDAVKALVQRIHAKIASGDWERTPRKLGDSSSVVALKD